MSWAAKFESCCMGKGAPRSASKLGIDPINSHASCFGKSTGSNKRNVPINRTVSSNWNQRVQSFSLPVPTHNHNGGECLDVEQKFLMRQNQLMCKAIGFIYLQDSHNCQGAVQKAAIPGH